MTGDTPTPRFEEIAEAEFRRIFEEREYVEGPNIVRTVLLGLRLGKSSRGESEPGCGRTKIGKASSDGFATDLIRLQCCEGLAAEYVF